MSDGRKPLGWVEEAVEPSGHRNDELDGDLITARGPGSSASAARTVLDELGIEQSA